MALQPKTVLSRGRARLQIESAALTASDGGSRSSALTGRDFLPQPASTFMTRQPKVSAADALGVEALRRLEAHKSEDLMVGDSRGRPVGRIDRQDRPKLRIG